MAMDPEAIVRAMLERAGVNASDAEVERLVAAQGAAHVPPSPGRTTEPHILPNTREWRR